MRFFRKRQYTFFYPIPLLSVYKIIDEYLSQPTAFFDRKPITGRCTSITTFIIISEGNGQSFHNYQSPMEGELWEVKQGCFLHLLIKPSWTTYLLFYTGIVLFFLSLLRSLITNSWNSIGLTLLLPLAISAAGIIIANANASTGKERFLRYIDSEIRSKIYGRHQTIDVHALIEEIIVRYLYYGGSTNEASQSRDYRAITNEIVNLVKTHPNIELLCNQLMDIQASGIDISPDRTHCLQVARMIMAAYEFKK